MDETGFFDEIKAEVAARSDGDAFGLFEPLLRELWAARERDTPPGDLRLEATDPLARALVDRGVVLSAAVRDVLLCGRALVERAESGAHIDPAATRRLNAFVDAAAGQLAAALEKARRQRRQAWLGFLAHEFKNPLNTVLNALWLLRERGSDAKQAARFVELAERAVRRLEARVLDMRALDEQLAVPPPGWEAQRTHHE